MKQFFKMIAVFILTTIALILIGGSLFIKYSPKFGADSSGAELEKMRSSLHFSNGKFKNLKKTVVSKNFKLSSIPEFFIDGDKTPKWSIPVTKLKGNYFEDYQDTLSRVTWFGHSAIFLEIDSKKIFIDPMLGPVPSPISFMGSKRFNDTLPASIENLPPIDAVIISHDHYDHLDYESILKIKDKVKAFFVPLGLKAHLISWGVEESKIQQLDWWEEVTFEGLTFTATPARHFSGRGLLDRYRTQWCSWVIQGKKEKIFFGGDSGYDESFKQIGEKYGPFDFTMLECGQYNEQWPEIHMMPEEVVQAHLDLKGQLLMPIHWGSFKLALHAWEEPVKRLLKKANSLEVDVTTPIIGEAIILGKSSPSSHWWDKKTDR